jgi:hypothetical protein
VSRRVSQPLNTPIHRLHSPQIIDGPNQPLSFSSSLTLLYSKIIGSHLISSPPFISFPFHLAEPLLSPLPFSLSCRCSHRLHARGFEGPNGWHHAVRNQNNCAQRRYVQCSTSTHWDGVIQYRATQAASLL